MLHPAGLDTSALSSPIDRGALASYRRLLPASVAPPVRSLISAASLFVLVLLSTLVWAVLLPELFSPIESKDWAFVAPLLLTYVLLVLATGFTLVRDLRKRSGRRQYRLDAFAAANGMTYLPALENPQLPGLIFDTGDSAIALDLVVRHGRVPVTVANYRYTTARNKRRNRNRWGYVAVKLGVELPHIVLDATGNNSLGRSNLPVSFAKQQRLALEGDFDRYFSLYCPVGYEADALYLFTPDVMAGFIDRVAELDVEIIDGYIFLYSHNDLATLDPDTWVWLFAVIDTVTRQAERWRRWRDGELGDTITSTTADGRPAIVRPPQGVGGQGRRLALKNEWLWAVLGIPFVILGVYAIVSDIVAAFGG